METYDFSGWATRANVRCSDGRTIMKDAFKDCDGAEVPLVWNHQHNEPENVLGKALLHNCDEGVYAYCTFNDSESGRTAKLLVQHGDVKALSIYANQLKEHMSHVSHGIIREVSLVLAGANPGAYIESVIKHGEESDEEAIIYSGEDIVLTHNDEDEESEETLQHASNEGNTKKEETNMAEDIKKNTNSEETVADVFNTLTEKQKTVVYALIGQVLEDAEGPDEEDEEEIKHSDVTEKNKKPESEETVADVFNTLTEKQKTVVYALIGQALEDADNSDEDDEEEMEYSEGGDAVMKHNVFENDQTQVNSLTHADQEEIIKMAKTPGMTLKSALETYASEHSNSLAHDFTSETVNYLFPDYKDVYPGAPGLLERDHDWVQQVLTKAHKSPVSRVRTRHIDARSNDVRAKGYNKRTDAKSISAALTVLRRTTDPQTIYYRDNLHRDDIVDITDFDVVAYQRNVMKRNLEEEVARAALIGDGREAISEDKISEDHIRPVWKDDDLFTIKATIDVEAMKTKLQGSSTSANFGDEYIKTEAIIYASLHAREDYKANGTPDFYCTPELLNTMLLARDLNGRRIYDSEQDLAKVLRVNNIFTVEQMDGMQRDHESESTKKYKLLGLFVNMANYQFGCTKGGEITSFEDFDIDFNSYKYLMETRLSGALVEPYSAIALEELVTVAAG